MVVTVNSQFTESRITWVIGLWAHLWENLDCIEVRRFDTVGQVEQFSGWDSGCVSGKAACIISLLLIVNAV